MAPGEAEASQPRASSARSRIAGPGLDVSPISLTARSRAERPGSVTSRLSPMTRSPTESPSVRTVALLQAKVHKLHGEQLRWRELHMAGKPRRLCAAEDLVRTQGQKAGVKAAVARDADCRALTQQKETENAARDHAEAIRRAQERARRAEEQATDFTKSLDEWRRKRDKQQQEARVRHEDVQAQAQARSQAVDADCEARGKAADEYLAVEVERMEIEFSREKAKLDRIREIAEARAADRRAKAKQQVEMYEAVAKAAEEKRDRQTEAADQRTRLAERAASSKMTISGAKKNTQQARAQARVEFAHDERQMRLEAAHAKENDAEEDRLLREEKAEKRIMDAELARQAVFEDCQAVEAEHSERVRKCEADLLQTMAVWKKASDEAEAASDQRVEALLKLALQLRQDLDAEVKAVAESAASDLLNHRLRASEHSMTLESFSHTGELHLAEVQQLAEQHVAHIDKQARQQLLFIERRGLAALDEANKQADLATTIAEGRHADAMGHLCNFLDSDVPGDVQTEEEERNLDLELWIPLEADDGDGLDETYYLPLRT